MTKLDSVSFKEARELAVKGAKVKNENEIVFLESALGRVLAEDVICQKNLPSFDNSAMDGFAFKYDDKGKRVKVVSAIFAGDKPKEMLKEGCCYKIMTGAKVPSDADTIAPIENCKDIKDGFVTLPQEIKKGNAFRKKGEEQRKGEVLLRKGAVLRPSDIALLASQGIVAVKVYKKLDIAIVSTGDEIKEPWEVADEDEIYNANGYGIKAMLEKYGFYASYTGSIPDNFEDTKRFVSSLKKFDVIITSGGISMGDADFLNEAFVENGLKSFFHGVLVKPGRPTMMGVMGDSFVMAMPGNPLTALLNTFVLSLPVLFKMQGSSSYHFPFVYTKSRSSFRLNPKRANLILGNLIEGEFLVTNDNKYGSGMITPMCQSSCVVICENGVSGINEGDIVKVIPFDFSATVNSSNNINEKRGNI